MKGTDSCNVPEVLKLYGNTLQANMSIFLEPSLFLYLLIVFLHHKVAIP